MNVPRHAATAAILTALGVVIVRWAVESDSPRAQNHLTQLLEAAGGIPAQLPFGQRPASPLATKIAGYIRMPRAELPPPPSLVIAALPPETPAAKAPELPAFDPAIDPMPVGAIENLRVPQAAPGPASSNAPPPPRTVPPELARFAAAAALYRKNDYPGADALAAQIADPLQRTALEWIALKASPSPDHDRLLAFETAHEDWPLADWIHEVREGWVYNKHAPAAYVEAMFAGEAPRTPAGVVALARARMETGQAAEAAELVRKFWREGDMDARAEAAVMKEFAGSLTRADHKYRADRLLYAERVGAAMRAASLTGPDQTALANARYEAMRGPLSARAIAAVPAALQSDPGLLFARVQDARRGNRPADAAALLAQAPHDPSSLIDPDKWWSERRMVARELIDRGNYKLAYDICAAAVTSSVPAHVDAAFHAGWIALRFMNDPATAAHHFAEASSVAITPLSVARANYWQGRAADALHEKDDARLYYERAAAYPIAYYGQLAARALGHAGLLAPRTPSALASGDSRRPETLIIDLYYQAGLDDFATPLAFAAAANWSDEAQIAGLAEVLARRADATVNTDYGKIATERGFALDETAFPTTGLPSFSLLPHSADIASVLAVARQESVFAWHAASGAGAKGLMQILPSTAAMTARRLGVPYDYTKLVFDAAFNLQLGAAYLGSLIEDEGGSVEMALAAYNAGPGAVDRWVASHGDPRTGAVDLVDWIELIPYDETRDYVERVSENLGIYRARLAGTVPRLAQAARAAPE